eukprot:Skav214383  [mRNA]  locus=scaffold3468:1435:2472:- [translate_table: standard]
MSLPGKGMFQEPRCQQGFLRSAILHSYGTAKADVAKSLETQASNGWEPLAVCLHGVQDGPSSLHAAFHTRKWQPAGGMLWQGTVHRSLLTPRIRAALLLRWTQRQMPEVTRPDLFLHLPFVVQHPCCVNKYSQSAPPSVGPVDVPSAPQALPGVGEISEHPVPMTIDSVPEAEEIQEVPTDDEDMQEALSECMSSIHTSVRQSLQDELLPRAQQHPAVSKGFLDLDALDPTRPSTVNILALLCHDEHGSKALDTFLALPPQERILANVQPIMLLILMDEMTALLATASTEPLDDVYVDCLGLGSRPLGLRAAPHLTLSNCSVDGDLTVYGPTLCPVDQVLPLANS